MTSIIQTWKERALSRRHFLRTTAGAAGVLGAGLLLPAKARADHGHRSTSPILDFDDHSIILPGSSTLIRKRDSVSVELTTSDLTPGNVYTFWWGVVSNPDADLVGGRITGFVAGRHGAAEIADFLNVGEIVGEPPIPGREGTFMAGDPLHAQIVVVVREHGPADPDRLFEQTQTFDADAAANARISIHDFR